MADVLMDTRRVLIFLALAFGIAWAADLVVYLTGGLIDSPELIPDSGITLALILIAGPVMWAPALAVILTRLLTREGWREPALRFNLRRNWPNWLMAWFLPSLLTVVGGLAYFLLFPRHFDPSMPTIRQALAERGVALNPWLIVVVQTVAAILATPLLNSLFTFGEELGWRAYLQPRLMSLGVRRAILLTGLIWGIWHWPLTAMGHNYGLEYRGAPWLGMLMMVWFTLVAGTVLGWLTMRSASVWPAVIGHAAVNGIAGLPLLFVQGNLNPLLGPTVVGLIGSLGWSVVALLILLHPRALPAPAEAGSVAPLSS